MPKRSTNSGKQQQSSASGSKCLLRTVPFEILKKRCSLKNHGANEEVEGMFDMGSETMDLPLEEKMKFEQGDQGNSFG